MLKQPRNWPDEKLRKDMCFVRSMAGVTFRLGESGIEVSGRGCSVEEYSTEDEAFEAVREMEVNS